MSVPSITLLTQVSQPNTGTETWANAPGQLPAAVRVVAYAQASLPSSPRAVNVFRVSCSRTDAVGKHGPARVRAGVGPMGPPAMLRQTQKPRLFLPQLNLVLLLARSPYKLFPEALTDQPDLIPGSQDKPPTLTPLVMEEAQALLASG